LAGSNRKKEKANSALEKKMEERKTVGKENSGKRAEYLN